MIGILWFDKWGDCDACDISLRLSFKALSPADCHVLSAIWLHCDPEVQEEQWRRENTDTERQRQRLDLRNNSIQAIKLHDGREKPKIILAEQPLTHAACMSCHLNSELVASKDRYVSTLPDLGGGEYVCCRRRPPWPLRCLQNSPLALHTSLLQSALCSRGRGEGRSGVWREQRQRAPRSLTYTFFLLGLPGIDGCSWADTFVGARALWKALLKTSDRTDPLPVFISLARLPVSRVGTINGF